MSKLIQPPPRTQTGLNDTRSTGAAPQLRLPDIQALRGTFKVRR